MPYTLTADKNFSLGGKQYLHQEVIENSPLEGSAELIPVAQPGILTTRTDLDTGSLTMDSASHGIATGNKIDLYWTNADGTIGSRRGMTVGAVAGVVVPIDLGLGADLPVAATVIQAAVVQAFDVTITGDDAIAILGACDAARCTIVLMSAGGTVEQLAIVLPAVKVYEWLATSGQPNPIVGDVIDKLHMTHNDTVTPREVRLAALLDV